MKLCFDSIAEVREFVAGLKGTRGKKGEGDDAGTDTGAGPVALPSGGAPAPIMPQSQGFAPPQGQTQPAAQSYPPQGQPQGFVPPQGYSPQGNSPGTTAPAGVDPVVAGLVQRLVAKIDATVQSGQPVDQALNWFRTQCGAGAENATLDQIKQHFLFRLSVAQLDQMAKLMAA